MKHDLRKSPWRKLAKARKAIEATRQDALDAVERAKKANDIPGDMWWSGRADGLRTADTIILSIIKEAQEGL